MRSTKKTIEKEENKWFYNVLILEKSRKDCSNNQAWSISEVLKSIREYSVDELKRDNRKNEFIFII